MALNTVQATRSGSFIRVYLITWGLLAAGALVYLASLAWQPSQVTKPVPRPQVTETDGSQSMRFATKALKEVSEVRRTVGDLQNDVSELKGAMGETAADARRAVSKVTELEGRLSSIDERIAGAPAAPAKAGADKLAKAPPKAKEPARALPTPPQDVAPRPAAKADGPPVPLETSSIAPSTTIAFGTAVVTPSSGTLASAPVPRTEGHAVQLAAGPSLPALRRAWGELVERHGAALATLQPRYVAPRSEGGPYRLLAGPLPSKAEAERVCTDMAVGRNGCYATAYTGEPL